MEFNTIDLDDEAYDQLKAEKREGESFSDTIKRITGEVITDWQHRIGKYNGEQADAFANAVQRSRETTNHGLAQRQHEINAMRDTGNTDREDGDGTNR
jgi:predicted CopG family antitoxin